MPRTLQEILDNQEELARKIADYQPDPADVRDPAPYRRLMSAVAQRGTAEAEIITAVAAARDAGYTWAAIGNILGTSAAAAQQRYGQLVNH